MKVICILNPLSRGGLTGERWTQVAELMASMGMEYELLAERGVEIYAQLMGRLERGGLEGIDVIAGIGGDGTQSAAINALMAYSEQHPGTELPPYGFIPMGTGNDIAKSFGLTSRADFFVDDLRRAVSTLAYGANYRLDLGMFRGRYFADALTIGLDCRILRERNMRKKQTEGLPLIKRAVGGNLLYALSTGMPFLRHKVGECRISVDGATWYEGPFLNIIINNTRIYAGVFDFYTDSHGNDGLLDVIVFAGRKDYFSRYILSMRHNPRKIRAAASKLTKTASHVQGKRIEIKLSQREAVQVDGDEVSASDAIEVAIVPHAIRIKTPAEP